MSQPDDSIIRDECPHPLQGQGGLHVTRQFVVNVEQGTEQLVGIPKSDEEVIPLRLCHNGPSKTPHATNRP
jgi:hypothetical protein